MKESQREHNEEIFHDKWARTIDINDLAVYQAFEGPVSPEYKFALKLLGNIKNKKILNPGCGAGEEAAYLAKKGAKVWAVDISSGMIEVTKKVASKFGVTKNVTTYKASIEQWHPKSITFDLVFGNSVLHHVSLEKALSNISSLLNSQGRAVFIEPLSYNPIINFYRNMADKVRTVDERPLTKKDIITFNKYFTHVKHYEFHFFTLLIFCYFFIFERVSPNKDRYWKKIIREGKKYESAFKILYKIDTIVLKLFPFLRWYCWATVIEASKK